MRLYAKSKGPKLEWPGAKAGVKWARGSSPAWSGTVPPKGFQTFSIFRMPSADTFFVLRNAAIINYGRPM